MTWLKAQTVFEKALHQGTERKKGIEKQKLYLFPVAEPGEGPGASSPLYFYTKLKPEGAKKSSFGDRYPLLMTGLPDPPVSRSGSSAGF